MFVCVYIYISVCMCVYVYIVLRAVYSPKCTEYTSVQNLKENEKKNDMVSICMLMAEGGKGANVYPEYIRWQQKNYML